MTVKGAAAAALDDWASSPGFDLDAAEFQLECLLQEAVDEWAEAHGWKYDEDQCSWSKETRS